MPVVSTTQEPALGPYRTQRPPRSQTVVETDGLRVNRWNWNTGRYQRVISFFRHGRRRYACKIGLQSDDQFRRELDVYRVLNQPTSMGTFRPTHDVSRFVYGSSFVLTPETTGIPVRFPETPQDPFVLPLTDEDRASMMHTFHRRQAKRGNARTSRVPLLYFVTEVHDREAILDAWDERLTAELSPNDHWMFRERVMHAALNVVVRAHTTHGFSHFDIHPGNVLLRVLYRNVPLEAPSSLPVSPASPDLRFEVRLFDFDLSYLPPADYMHHRPEYHLWYHAALRGADRPETYAPFARYGMVWDLLHIARLGIPKQHDARPWKRLGLHMNRLVPGASESIDRMLRTARSLHASSFDDVAAWIRSEAARPGARVPSLYPYPSHRSADSHAKRYAFPVYARSMVPARA